MSLCVEIQSGVVLQSSSALDSCAGYVLVSAQEYGLMAANMVLTPEDVIYLYAWGMGAVLIPWSMAYAISVAKAVINKL